MDPLTIAAAIAATKTLVKSAKGVQEIAHGLDGLFQAKEQHENNKDHKAGSSIGKKNKSILQKRARDDGYAWHIHNSVMSPHNPVAEGINANDTGTEATSTFSDFTANGFKLRAGSNGGYNGSATYIYLAFAEHPFGGDGVAQAKAR